MKQRGDTLIEVLFGFVILGVVISVAFSGALTSYKSVVSAQNRTQATFAVKYQAEALKTYRQSLEFSGPNTNFLNSVPSNNDSFCMDKAENNGVSFWQIKTVAGCNEVAKRLAPNLANPSLSIVANKTANTVTANIVLEWDNRSGQRDRVTNTVVLTKGIEQ